MGRVPRGGPPRLDSNRASNLSASTISRARTSWPAWWDGLRPWPCLRSRSAESPRFAVGTSAAGSDDPRLSKTGTLGVGIDWAACGRS